MKCLKNRTFRAALSLGFLLLPVLSANATGSHTPTPPTSAPSHVESSSNSAAKASAASLSASSSKSQSASASSAKQDQEQEQKQRQSQQLKNSGNSRTSVRSAVTQNATGGDSQATSEGSIVSVGGDTIEAPDLPVNTAVVSLANTTAQCHYHNGGAGQGSALGLSLSIGRKDGDCERFMLAEFMYARGNDEAGDRIFCAIKSVHKALGSDCLVLVHQTRIVQLPDPRILKREEFERTQGYSK